MVSLGSVRFRYRVRVRNRVRVSFKVRLVVLYFINLYSVDGATSHYRAALNLRLNIYSVQCTEPTTVR